jgi:uncharacterized membrane-anchored protein
MSEGNSPAVPSIPPGTVNKVAQVTAAFWVMKICATTLGETAGDLLSMTLAVGYAVSSLILVGLFVVALAAQLRTRTLHAPLFWAVVLLTSTAGTTMADYMNRTLQLGYATGALILASSLALVLLVWRVVEGSLSVSRIETRRAEVFYWAAILCSNTLGTALGDYLADDSGLGFLGSAALIAGLLAAILATYRFTSANRVALFWMAFVLTRPFGAAFGDLLTKPASAGGLDLGTFGASEVLAAVLVAAIVWSERRDRRMAAAQ